MLAALIIMTLLVGMFFGFTVAVALAIHMDNRDQETKRRHNIHPSGRSRSILDYTAIPN